VTASFTPAGAAEFPNDNPVLHHGARWVCGATCGPARALWRASSDGVDAAQSSARSGEAPPLAVASIPSPPASEPSRAAARMERCLDGPLQLDLHRIVLRHRVEDVPAPPDFIYRPLVSARARAAPPAMTARPIEPLPIEPRPCRIVDTRPACQRVQRGWRVDVAPCVHIGAGERRPSRHRGGMVASSVVASSVVASSVVASPAPRLPGELQPELQAASA
jgi:hypothetical protein